MRRSLALLLSALAVPLAALGGGFDERASMSVASVVVLPCPTDSFCFAKPLAVDPFTGRVFAHTGSVRFDDVLHVLDGETSEIGMSVLTGKGVTNEIAYSPGWDRVYVLGTPGGPLSGSDHVLAVDAATGAVAGTIPGFGSPEAVAVDPVAGRLYVADLTREELVVIDEERLEVLGRIGLSGPPRGVAVDPGREKAFVTIDPGGSRGFGAVDVVDGHRRELLRTIELPRRGFVPRGIDFDALSGTMFVATFDGDDVERGALLAVDAARETIRSVVPLSPGAKDVAVDAIRRRVYVVQGFGDGDDVVSAVDIRRHGVLATAIPGANPQEVVVSPATGTVYVSSRTDGTVTAFGVEELRLRRGRRGPGAGPSEETEAPRRRRARPRH